MRNNNLLSSLSGLLMPLLMLLLGIFLLINPTGALALVSEVLAWVLCIYGGVMLLGALSSRGGSSMLSAVLCLVLGLFLMRSPLFLVRNFCRILGLLLLLDAVPNLLSGGLRGTNLLTLVGGVILLLAPMTASRLVLSVCGLGIAVLGGLRLLEALRGNHAMRPRGGGGTPRRRNGSASRSDNGWGNDDYIDVDPL